MRTNFFGECVLQPGDNIQPEFERFHNSYEPELTAWFVELADGDWGCEVRDQDENIIMAEGFATEESLREWLSAQGVRTVD